MTRVIKGFAVDWGDRWRRTVWAQLQHIYWFNVSPDRQVEFDRSSSPAALNEGDPGRLEATRAVKEFVEQETVQLMSEIDKPANPGSGVLASETFGGWNFPSDLVVVSHYQRRSPDASDR